MRRRREGPTNHDSYPLTSLDPFGIIVTWVVRICRLLRLQVSRTGSYVSVPVLSAFGLRGGTGVVTERGVYL